MPERPALSVVLDTGIWPHTELLVRSVRRHERTPHRVNLCVPEDRRGDPAVARTLERLAPLGATPLWFENDFHRYRIGNKICALAAHGPGPALFLDSDSIFVRPFEVPRPEGAAVRANRADYPTWDLRAKAPLIARHLDAPVDAAELEYLNAGAILLADAAAFAGAWKALAHAVDADDRIPRKRPWLDQITLPFVAAAHRGARTPLGPAWNVSGHIRGVGEEAVHVHYHHTDFLFTDPVLRRTAVPLIEEAGIEEELRARFRYPRPLRRLERALPGSVRRLVRWRNHLRYRMRVPGDR